MSTSETEVDSGRRKSPLGLFDGFLLSAARTPCAPLAHNSHTCSLISIFRQVHALAETVFHFVFHRRGKFCEAFSTLCVHPRNGGGRFARLWRIWRSRRFRSACGRCILRKKSCPPGNCRVPGAYPRKHTSGGPAQEAAPKKNRKKTVRSPVEDRFSRFPAIFPASIGTKPAAAWGCRCWPNGLRG